MAVRDRAAFYISRNSFPEIEKTHLRKRKKGSQETKKRVPGNGYFYKFPYAIPIAAISEFLVVGVRR